MSFESQSSTHHKSPGWLLSFHEKLYLVYHHYVPLVKTIEQTSTTTTTTTTKEGKKRANRHFSP
jgi:hypothetical protein